MLRFDPFSDLDAMTQRNELLPAASVESTDIYHLIKRHVLH